MWKKKILSDYFVKDIKNKDIEVILVWNQVVDDEFLNKFPKLKGIVRYGVGYE